MLLGQLNYFQELNIPLVLESAIATLNHSIDNWPILRKVANESSTRLSIPFSYCFWCGGVYFL